MNLLVTAGNTQVMIDRVRCITNVFTGRTGASIALAGHELGHTVTLLTSHPEVVAELCDGRPVPTGERWTVRSYRTFEDLQSQMHQGIHGMPLHAIIHCAAVSDYLADGVFAPAQATTFDRASGQWQGVPTPTLVDRAAGKVKSDEPELWIRLVRAPKLIDLIRPQWGFRGVLVKFKLEVGLSDEELLRVAERSRAHSGADLMVANTLEGAAQYAFIGTGPGHYEKISRIELPARLLAAIDRVRREGK